MTWFNTLYDSQYAEMENYYSSSNPTDKNAHLPLAARGMGWFYSTKNDISPGRRLRVLANIIRPMDGNMLAVCFGPGKPAIIKGKTRKLTYREAYNAIHRNRRAVDARAWLSELPLRTNVLTGHADKILAIPGDFDSTRDPDLHPALQDLAYEIGEDVHEACFAFNDPDVYYPGVDEGIEPVTDEHVELVIWAMQRELNRELRPRQGASAFAVILPSAPLSELPWRVQRALTERRRLRYQQYGIGREQWERGTWSLFEVPEDWDFVPRRHVRMLGEKS